MDSYVRKATKVGKRSMAVVIPAEIAKNLGIKERQKLSIRQSGQKIVIEDWKHE